jgi:hypothetical protein
MARVRRSERRHAPDPTPFDLDNDLVRVAGAARTSAEPALGVLPDLAGPPEPVFAGCGPGAYRVRLATDHPVWGRPLLARVAPVPDLVREAAWIGWVRSTGFPAPHLVADGRTGVLVFREPAGTNLAERMITDMAALPRLLADFGRLHAALHALPPVDAPEGQAVAPAPGPSRPGGAADVGEHDEDGGHCPHHTGAVDSPGAVDLVAEADDAAVAAALRADAADGAGVADQVAWLDGHAPTPGAPAVCHGDLHPAHVYLDGDAAVPVNWTGAGLGDPERDVAATLTGFWTAALYVDSAVQRRVLKMVRDSLAGAYLAAYRDAARRPLDDTRLRYWQAFHLCRVGAGIVRHRIRGATGPWDTAAHVAQPSAALDELAREFWRVAGD